MTEKDNNPEHKAGKTEEIASKAEEKKAEIKGETKKPEEKKEKKETEKTEEKKEEKIKSEKPAKKTHAKPKVLKEEVFVNVKDIPISTKHAMAICNFIKYRKIEDSISDLEQVILGKKAIPMKGEIPHRKGKMMSGRFPKNASKQFIILLKSLLGNARANEIEEPIVTLAVANFAPRPFGKFGRVRKKRTHVLIKARIKKQEKKKTRREIAKNETNKNEIREEKR